MASSSKTFNQGLVEKKNEISQHSFFPSVLNTLIENYCYVDSTVTRFKTLDGELRSDLIDKYNLLIFDNNEEHLQKYFTKEQIEVLTLLNHVVRGEKDQAEKLIKKNPKLLLCEGIVTDYSGRDIKGTALKIALGAEDVNIHEQSEVEKEEGMAEMIMRYMRELNNGEAAIKDQINEQFPEGWVKEEKKREAADKNALDAVLKAIDEAKATTFENLVKECSGALDIFRKHFMPKGIIDSGKHFNWKVLLQALERYDNDDNFKKFGDAWDKPKNLMFWRMVIGFIQRFAPACMAQAFSQGIYYIVDKQYNEKLTRVLKFRFQKNGTDVIYCPLDSDSRFRLGFDYAGGATPRHGVRGWVDGVLRVRDFQNLCRAKTTSLQNIMRRPKNPTSVRCVIM